MSWVDHVLARFDRARALKRSATWIARCPAHDDRTPSLGIWLGRNGTLIIRCWATPRGGAPRCSLADILHRVGLTMSDLFPPEQRKEDGPYGHDGAGRRSFEQRPKYREIEAYDYVDEAGGLIYQVVRFEPKNFAQRRPSQDNRCGWSWGLGDCRRVLYRLPKLIVAQADMPVLVCEGERDVHSAESLGLLATTNAGGVGMGWRKEYSLTLTGRRVVIVPDNDGPGRARAEAIAGSLLCHGASSIRVVHLPGLQDKEDLSDWLRKYKGDVTRAKAALVEIVRAAPEWKAQT